ncbi:RidA family protein [Gudongella oleilytica]|uniref:RidA family protein n=1 Tax=Gudongella oleilytica TaxID=1582259 RepID=UPI002A3685B3|nr:RidA family protein [Gudongella oleilytica]MDY0256782.1 RidA family protein [Gudongella oleilytica]
MSEIEKKLGELGIILPGQTKSMGNYVTARRSGNILYLSGNGPMREGKVVMSGKLGADLTVEQGYEAARITAINILGVLKSELGDLDKINQFVKVLGFVQSTDDFYDQPKVINGASDLFVEVLGEKGRHARSAIGTCVLPFNLPVEIEVIVEVD